MPQKIQNPASQSVDNSLQIPALEFDPRTGQPLFPKEYYDNPNPFNVPPVGKEPSAKQSVKPKAVATSQKSSYPRRGMWLSRKMQSLYDDPKFQQGSPEQQKHWKELAYERWITPYYKNVMKTDPPALEFFTDPQKYGENVSRSQFWTNAFTKDKVHGLEVLKETSHVIAGVQDDLAFVGKGLDFIFGGIADKIDQVTGFDKTIKHAERTLDTIRQREFDPNFNAQVVPTEVMLKNRKGPIESYYGNPKDQPFRDLEQFYQDRIDDLEQGKKKIFVEKAADKIPTFVTDGVFFEATGGRKLASALRIGYPKLSGFIAKRAIDSLNGAVDFAIWNKTTGESGVEGLKWGAMFGPVVTPIFNALFKFGGAESLKRVVNDATQKASGKVEAAVQEVAKPHPTTEKATQVVTDAMNGYSQEKFGKPYADLAFIQKQHVLNKVLAEANVAVKTASENIHPEIVQAASKEEREMVESIFPEAKKAQQNVDNFVKQNSNTPETNKLLATLPHHNTTVDSSWNHLQARVSFLKGRLRTARNIEDQKALTAALNEEYSLMKEKAEREKIKKAAAEGKIRAQGTDFSKEDYEWAKKSGLADAEKQAEKAKLRYEHDKGDHSARDEYEDRIFRVEKIKQQIKKYESSEGKSGYYLSELEEKDLRDRIRQAAKEGKFRAEASKEGRTVGLPDYKIKFADPSLGFQEWAQDGFARGIARHFFEAYKDASEKMGLRNPQTQTLRRHYSTIDNAFMVASNLSRRLYKQEGFTKQLYHPQYGVVGGMNYEFQGVGTLGENSGFKPGEKILYINWLGARPNVVARVWNVPGVGQSLFLDAAQEAYNHGTGIALIPFDESVPFYKKMGMDFVGSYMAMSAEGVKDLLKNKGLLGILYGAGIYYGASQSEQHGDYSVKGATQ